jgi:NTP pyrophosphatase (non-canonical NTP hydrolase)
MMDESADEVWLVVLLAFVVCGSLAFELLRLFPVAWDFVATFLRQVGAVFK